MKFHQQFIRSESFPVPSGRFSQGRSRPVNYGIFLVLRGDRRIPSDAPQGGQRPPLPQEAGGQYGFWIIQSLH